MALTDDEIEELVRAEFRSMSEAKKKIATQNKESFLSWFFTALKRVASVIGELVSAPFKALLALLEGFFGGVGRGLGDD